MALPLSTTYEFESLTPLWTGDANGVSAGRTLETSILGSIRWWLEVLARGAGHAVADLTEAPAEVSGRLQLAEALAAIDAVSRLMGATGWKRQFSLRIELVGDVSHSYPGLRRSLLHSHPAIKTTGKDPTVSKWYLKSAARHGKFQVTLILRNGNPQILEVIKDVLFFAGAAGGVGAKTQLGFGVSRSESKEPRNLSALTEWISHLESRGPVDPALPSLRSMFFARIPVTSADDRQLFKTKFELRGLLRTPNCTQQERHFLMGKVQGKEREGSKIHISIPYPAGAGRWEYRCWGWVPAQYRPMPTPEVREPRVVILNRDRVLDAIKGYFPPTVVWREFNSARDTVVPHENDYGRFVRSIGGAS